jgi:hypothetical protein
MASSSDRRNHAAPATGRIARTGLGLLLVGAAFVAAAAVLEPAELDGDLLNPHRGLMLWGSDFALGAPLDHYGARIFHVYLPWRDIEPAADDYDWEQLEQTRLQPILDAHPEASFVLRLVADYPDGPGSNIDAFYARDTDGAVIEPHRDFPAYLLAPPLSLTPLHYSAGGPCGLYGSGVMLPWNEPALIERMEALIAAFGARYDGDPRLTAVQFGLLGYWGEWHAHGCDTHSLASEVRARLAAAFAAAFVLTPLQTRYAREPDATEPVGFHEDYFPSFTVRCADYPSVPLCSDSGSHNLDAGFRLQPALAGHWRSHPLGGESPMTQQKQFWHDEPEQVAEIVRRYHFSLLGPAGGHQTPGQQAAIDTIGRALGYRFVVSALQWNEVVVDGAPLQLQVRLRNRGSAPLYHPFPLRLLWLDPDLPQVLAGSPLPWELTAVMPDDPDAPAEDTQWSAAIEPPPELPHGAYRLALAAERDGRRLRFANHGLDHAGRLILGPVRRVPQRVFADGFE